MRLIIDSLVALALVAVVVIYFAQQRSGDRVLEREEQVRANLETLHERTAFHAALRWGQYLQNDERPATKYPVEVDPAWFGGAQPGNAVAERDAEGRDRPWLDVAPTGDWSEHPPDPVLVRPGQAGFWYNPNNGVFRARTPLEAGDAMTLARYNRLNDTALAELPRDTDPQRQPLAYTPGRSPGSALAHGTGRASVDLSAQTSVALDAEADPAALFAPVEFEFDLEWETPESVSVAQPEKPEPSERPSLITR